MTERLSGKTWEVLNACFADEEQRREVGLRLESEFIGEFGPEPSERITFSIIRLILENCDKDYTDTAFDLAKADWRDLLMASGHGEDPHGHQVWAEEVIREQPRVLIVDQAPQRASMNGAGWAKCPNCGFRFKPSDPNAWDGKRHKKCLQRLQIEGLD